MIVTVDSLKLEKVIQEEVAELLAGPWCAGAVCVGEFKGMQVHVVVTKEADDFMEPGENICIKHRHTAKARLHHLTNGVNST